MQQKELAQRLAALHVKGKPLVIYNAWDAGSARAIAEAGARVVGTSSWAVAAAQGYQDGESIPMAFAEQIIAGIARTVGVPLTVDVEGGYSEDPRTCAENVGRLVDLGVAGINFEDRIVLGAGLHDIAAQVERIAAIRRMADARGIPLVINARTDLFFGAAAAPHNLLDEARERAAAYARAGANGFFVPGLTDLGVIAQLCASIDLPLNVMVMPGLPDRQALAGAGVARISYGPQPYLQAMDAVRHAAGSVLA